MAASPIAFPIAWHNSKIPGYAVRVSVPNFHGFTALTVFSSVAARFLPPQGGRRTVLTRSRCLPHSLGIRGDFYNGFVSDRQAEPRLGIAYKIMMSFSTRQRTCNISHGNEAHGWRLTGGMTTGSWPARYRALRLPLRAHSPRHLRMAVWGLYQAPRSPFPRVVSRL